MIDKDDKTLSVVRQCALLKVARSSLYYHPSRNNNDDLTVMALIDRQFLEMPCYGSRKMTAWLRLQGHAVNRKRVRRLMREMGLTPIYQKPRTSQPHPDHQIYPYLLRGLAITRPNQVWAADITYIPMARGFLYVVAIMDWYSRKVLSWRLSNTLEAEFCVTALEDGLAQYGRPEIFNTDQGCQFTSTAFTSLLKAQDVRISMDGQGRCLDNIFVERLWRSLKYEEVYLRAYANGSEARAGIGAWFASYNTYRLHQALDYKTPDQVYAAAPAGGGHAPHRPALAA